MDTPPATRSRSLRFYLLLVCAMTAIPAILVLGLQAVRHLSWARDHAYDQVRMAAESAAFLQGNVTGKVMGLFSTFSHIIPLRQAEGSHAGKMLSRILDKNPEYANLVLVSPEGTLIASARPTARTDYSKRQVIQNALKTKKFSASAAMVSEVTGETVLPFAIPVLDDSGEVAGVLSGGLKLTPPSLLAEKVQHSPAIRILFLDGEGTFVASYPAPDREQAPFTLVPLEPRTHSPDRSGDIWLQPGPDGGTWIFAEQVLSLAPGTPPYLRIVAGMPEQAALDPLLKDFRRDYFILGTVVAASLLLAYLVGDAAIVRRLERLTAVAGRIAGGDLKARTGMRIAPREVARLGEAFDQMASALERREGYRRNIVEALRKSRKRFKDVASSVSDWIWEVDREGRITFVSGKVRDVMGYSPGEMRGAMFYDYMIPGEKERLQAIFQNQLTGPEPIGDLEIWQLTKDGRKICLRTVSLPVLDSRGRVMGFRGVCVDVTEQKLAEQSLLRSLAEKEVLLKEVHHRVKNNLQIITSLMNLQSQEFVHLPEVEQAFEQMRGRVRSIAMLHERLYATGDFSAVEMGGYIRTLVESVRFAHELPGRHITLLYDLTPLSLSLEQALPFSLILNEALTNSFRHGLADARDGNVLVSLAREKDNVVLTVQDNGGGLPADVLNGARRGLGFQLIDALADQLGGNAEFFNPPDGGAAVRVSFPSATA